MSTFYPSTLPMAQQMLPDANAKGVVFTGQLTAQGSVSNTTTETGQGYAYVNRLSDITASPYAEASACACGSRNIDGACVTGSSESMPYQDTTVAQTLYLQSLWDTQPYMPISATDRYTMLREAPTGMGLLPSGPL
jgi:hypothetical protein